MLSEHEIQRVKSNDERDRLAREARSSPAAQEAARREAQALQDVQSRAEAQFARILTAGFLLAVAGIGVLVWAVLSAR